MMYTLDEFLNRRIRFKTISGNIGFEGRFVGIGKTKSQNIIGLIFDRVVESVCENITSMMLIHPNEISPTDGVSFEFIQYSRIAFKNNGYKQNDVAKLFYPINKIQRLPNISDIIKVA